MCVLGLRYGDSEGGLRGRDGGFGGKSRRWVLVGCWRVGFRHAA